MPLSQSPIAFKGPSDHLNQFFSQETLYEACQLLIKQSIESQPIYTLHDWFYDKEQSLISAVLKCREQNKQYHLELNWPLDLQNSNCDCQQQDCLHLAALALESKRRIDVLPVSLKDAQAGQVNWRFFQHWRQQQFNDPYPNMARHRLVYLLRVEDSRCHISVCKAYLSKQDEYQVKAEFDLSAIQPSTQKNSKTVSARTYPKFVSQTDQLILQLIGQGLGKQTLSFHSKSSFTFLTLENNELLETLLASRRLFWKACFRPPLQLQIQLQPLPEQVNNPEQLQALTDTLLLDTRHNAVNKVELINQPLKTFISTYPQTSVETKITPQLQIQSHHINLSTNNFANFDCARLSFIINQQTYSLDDLNEQQASLKLSATGRVLLNYAASANRLLDWLPSLALKLELPFSQYFNTGDRYLESNFAIWAPLLLSLQQRGWLIDFNKSFRMNQLNSQDWYFNLNSSQAGWFDLEIAVTTQAKPSLEQQQTINLLPYLVQAFQQGNHNFSDIEKLYSINSEQLLFKLESGENLLLDKDKVEQIFKILTELIDRNPLSKTNTLSLPNIQLSRLNEFNKISTGKAFIWAGQQELKDKALSLSQQTALISVEPPIGLRANLRAYQQKGLNWLQFLSRNDLGGILADDMGLGKTIQTLAHILLEKESGKMQSPCLIIVPTSLLTNWKLEAKRFTPSLKVLVLSGPKRQQYFDKLAQFDLIISSYGTSLRDIKHLQRYRFHLLVLDEAQAIKNARSQITNQVSKLNSQHRLCLTGTPLENHLGELWSIFNFLMPGFLGSQAQFRRLYQEPIEKQQDYIRQQSLAQRITPFMLRRNKQTVATELPDKVIIEEVIELTPKQQQLYETIRLSMSDEIQRLIHSESGKANQLLISNAILRLRQICCHPQLTPFEAAQDINDSAKLNWLTTMLPSMVAEGRRILLFSSFTSMLDIIASTLQSLSIEHLMLTGKSQNRGRIIEKFQTGDIPIFLISLKAGGAGLNLTAADTVIHYDPWWNPAAEQQASDRAHRIGQDKSVFVYKLISKGTVEQRILELQKGKQQLADKLYQSSSSHDSNLKDIDWLELLKPMS